MGISYVRASSQYASLGRPLISAAPFTMACWFQADQTNFQILMALCRNSTTGEYWRLGARGDVAGNPVEFITGSQTNGQGDTAANTTTGFVSGTWYHACGVEYASNRRAVFINGGSKGTGSTTVTPVSVNDAYIGAYKFGGNPIEAYLNGMVAEAGWWNRALDDAEVALLARGKRPSEIRPGALVEYVPQIRGLDSYKRNGWTGNNGLALTQHPPLWARRSRVFAGTSPPPPPPSNNNYFMPLLGVGDD